MKKNRISSKYLSPKKKRAREYRERYELRQDKLKENLHSETTLEDKDGNYEDLVRRGYFT
jgi:hypothetical protein